MKPIKMDFIQTASLIFAGASALTSLVSKYNLSVNPSLSPFIQQNYFIENLNHAGITVYVYWISQAFFLTGMICAAIIEFLKRKM